MIPQIYKRSMSSVQRDVKALRDHVQHLPFDEIVTRANGEDIYYDYYKNNSHVYTVTPEDFNSIGFTEWFFDE